MQGDNERCTINAQAEGSLLASRGPLREKNSLIRVRIVNPVGLMFVGRMLRVAGRLVAVLRDKIERVAYRVEENISVKVVCRNSV